MNFKLFFKIYNSTTYFAILNLQGLCLLASVFTELMKHRNKSNYVKMLYFVSIQVVKCILKVRVLVVSDNCTPISESHLLWY